MSEETVPITLNRRTPYETTAYHQGYNAGLLACLNILNDPSVNPIEQILILLEVHKGVQPLTEPTSTIDELAETINKIHERYLARPAELQVRQAIFEAVFWEIYLRSVEIGCIEQMGPPRLPKSYLFHGVKITSFDAEPERIDFSNDFNRVL